MAGSAAPESEIKPAPSETAQVAPEEAPSIQAAPGVEAIGQIRYAAARDVDDGTSAQQQSQTTAQDWNVYRR